MLQAAHLAAIVEYSEDAIVSKTLDGRIKSWNAGAERIFGYTPHEAIGQSIKLIVPNELHDEERQILERIRNGERIEHFDTTRLTKDGRRISISLTVSPVRDARGVIVGASKIARDISDRKRVETQLLKTEEALRDADRRKDEFMALLAHELRNLLAPIRYATVAARKSEPLGAQQSNAMAVIERQAAHMSRLLDDLLDVSRITHGTLDLKRSVTELTVVIGSAIEAARPILDAKQHTLELKLPKQAVRLNGDPVRLSQVFSNLLINAAKYTHSGGHIEIRAEQISDAIVVTVRDNGIGISSEMLPKIFKMFTQDPEVLGSAEGGLGIGLALVQGIVSLHDGHIKAMSNGAGTGSEFIVHLPIGVLSGSETHPIYDIVAPAGSTGLRVLIVDDNKDVADTCSALVEFSGHQVKTAYTGRQALELAAAFVPNVILADISLPDIDGYKLARQIRANPWGRAVVLIAITGWGHDEDKRRALQAGFDDHLTKPIAAEMLEALLQAIKPKQA